MKSRPNSALIAALLATPLIATAADYEWTFNNGTLNDFFNNGAMTAAGATVPAFATTDGVTIPHIGGVPANILNVPVMPTRLEGFNLTLGATVANGGGLYLNRYSVVMDIFSPGGAAYQALFQAAPDNPETPGSGNDADWYIHPSGKHGLGGTYTPDGSVAQNTWYRIAFTADLSANRLTYYIDGVQRAQGFPANANLDGRFSLYTSTDPGADVRLFNEGDNTGNYTHQLYVNSIAFSDHEMTAGEIAALGGPSAAGILVPEPASGMLAFLGLAGLAARRRR